MGTKSISNLFLNQLFSFSLGPVFGAVFTFCASILITWLAIPDDVGKVSMFTTTLALLSLFTNLGLDRAYMREYSATDKKEELLFTCLSLSLLSSFIVALLILLQSDSISNILFDKHDVVSVLLLALILPINVFGDYGIIITRLRVDKKKYTILVLIEKVSYLVFIYVYIVFLYNDYRSIIYARCTSILFKALLAFIVERSSFRIYTKLNRSLVKKILKYGVPYMPALIFSWLLHSMDKYALRIFSSYEEIGLYATAISIVSMLAILQTAFSSFWTPLAYKWYEEGREKTYFEKVGNILTSTLMVCSGLVVLLRELLVKVYSPEYSMSSTMIPFLLFIISMETISYVVGCGINLKRKTIYNTIASFLACLVNLIGNYLLVPTYGGLGASISTGLSCILFMLVKMFVSRKLWYNFSCSFVLNNTIIMILFCFFSVYFHNILMDLLIFSLIIIYNYKTLLLLSGYLYSFVCQMSGNKC